MDISSQVKHALSHAGAWLIKIRTEKGSWQDMVYKRQGILNTAEAWLSLAEIRPLLTDVSWQKQWIRADLKRLTEEINVHGFLRSPYYPENRPHESIDAAAGVLLMLQSVQELSRAQPSQTTQKLTAQALDWLVANQSKTGGWSWGAHTDGRPLYPYFTYMAIKALQGTKDRTTKALRTATGTTSKTLQGTIETENTPPQDTQHKTTQKALKTGIDWLLSAQLSDGSYPVHSQSSKPDIASTAYAAIALSEAETPKAHAAQEHAIRYLLSASLSDLTQVAHLKIVEPDQPPQRQIDYENYSVAANVLMALIKAQTHMNNAPQLKNALPLNNTTQLNDRIQFLVQHLLQHQAPQGGWPTSYSTIYTTHTSVAALATYLKHTPAQPHPNHTPPTHQYNPYIFGFPIQHPHLFFGRESIISRIRADIKTAPEVKRDLALIGERRIGKTSLLYQLPLHLKKDGHKVFYLDLELMQSVPQFLHTFIKELGNTVFSTHNKMKTRFARAIDDLDRKHFAKLNIELQTPFLKLSTARTQSADTQDLFVAFLADVERLTERFQKWRPSSKSKIVVLLDEIAYLQTFAPTPLLSLLRGIAQQTADLVFIVAGTPKACRMLTDAASPFYNIFTPIRLGQLEKDAAIALITEPVRGKIRYTSQAIAHLLHASQQHPYTLSALCYACIRLLPASQNQITDTTVQLAIKEWHLMKDWK